MTTVNYNERSWAIDVISQINLILVNKSWYFKSAGGENTISYDKKSLFPDILLFKNLEKNIIVNGWELKMPDTSINDSELITNAIKKAKILNTNSFVLWNVTSAVLYIRNDNDDFKIFKRWDDINISSRSEVQVKSSLWIELLNNILTDLNDLYFNGTINNIQSTDIVSVDNVLDVILENTNSTVDYISQEICANNILEAEINNWWLASSSEYGYKADDNNKKIITLAQVVLTDWVSKIFFANILKKHFNEAKIIDNLCKNTSISQALDIFASISDNCNFWNIFSKNIGQEFLSDSAWYDLQQLNEFLKNINLTSIDNNILQNLLQNVVVSAKRKSAGQYSTPVELAELLTRLTISDKTKNVLDPCCGTGTIINQAYKLKEEYGINNDNIIDTIWASDKYSFPIQLSTMTLSRPENLGKIVNIFKKDVIDLNEGLELDFKNPNNGAVVKKQFPKIDYIISNLPFIEANLIDKINSEITSVNNLIKNEFGGIELSGKSDIFAYIPFHFHKYLSTNGKIGLILSNAWLGTDYGRVFIENFLKFYKIEKIIISGKGKWFDNADVVSSILIATKKEYSEFENYEISFVTIKQKLNEIENIKLLSEKILLDQNSDNIDINKYSLSKIQELNEQGFSWSALFTDLTWIQRKKNKLININKFFDNKRGERRGWNPLFYPTSGHNINSIFIKPVLKNLRQTKSLISTPNAEAFCCSLSLEELEGNYFNTFQWVKGFENQRNGVGKLLPEVLSRPNMYWYEMKTDNMVEFVSNVNFDKSLFIAMCSSPSFVDQRLIGLSLKEQYKSLNKELLLALLNSTLSMFFIESLGFGRGLGALDLNATKFGTNMKILDPLSLNQDEINQILRAFEPIKQRDRLPLLEELESIDRINFENILMKIYGISEEYNNVKKSLLDLYNIRFAVNY